MFKVKRQQFGISVTPDLFQELMENLLKGILGVIPYFDDVLMIRAFEQELVECFLEVLCGSIQLGSRSKKKSASLVCPR